MPPEVAELPAAYQFGQIADPDQRMDACFALGQALAAQCAAFGFNLDFAPVMDIWSNPDNTVIGDRAFGSDLESVTYAANETAWGILSGGVIAAAKHFPGHGDTAVDSHYGLPVVDKSLEELLDFELVPFCQAIENTCVYGAAGGDSAIPVSYTHLDVYKRQSFRMEPYSLSWSGADRAARNSSDRSSTW